MVLLHIFQYLMLDPLALDVQDHRTVMILLTVRLKILSRLERIMGNIDPAV